MTDPIGTSPTHIQPLPQRQGIDPPAGGQSAPNRPQSYLADERVQISGSKQFAVQDESQIARGVMEHIDQGLRRSLSALQSMQQLAASGPASPESLHPHAMKVLEAAGSSFHGINALDHDGHLTVGPHRIQSFQLAGHDGSPLVPFAAMTGGENQQQDLQLAAENLQWAIGQNQRGMESLDLASAQKAQSAAGSMDSPPIVPSNPGVEHHLSPRRVVELLS